MLKFEGFKIGTKIRAYDFQPMPDRDECYVEGTITALAWTRGSRVYVIDVTADTVHEKGSRTVVNVPLEVAFLEWDGRVSEIPGTSIKETIMDYNFTWEGVSGMFTDFVLANSFQEACKILTDRHPDDEGADGFCDLPDGSERAIIW